MKKFRNATRPLLDLDNPEHEKALLNWLNAWGGRQFAKDYHDMASGVLVEWGQRYIDRLPGVGVALTKLSDTALDAIAEAYGDLKGRSAGKRVRESISIAVHFGATGAAKVLHALRPNALPPWDGSIRRHFRYDGSPGAYRRFLGKAQEHVRLLEEEAARFGIRSGSIPRAVGRPDSSLPKLVDECYFVTITKKCRPPTREKLQRWTLWATSAR